MFIILQLRNESEKYSTEENGFMIPDPEHAIYGLQDITLTDNFLIYCTNV